MADKNWPIIGLEAMGMSLEDVFINIVDDSVDVTQKNSKGGRRKYDYESRRAEEGRDIARQIRANAESAANDASEDAED